MTNSMDKVEDIVGRLRMSALAIREVERCSPAYLGTGSQIEVAADLIQSQQALIEEMREALAYAHKGLDMVHNGLMDPTRPRQSVGEVCAHFLDASSRALSQKE